MWAVVGQVWCGKATSGFGNSLEKKYFSEREIVFFLAYLFVRSRRLEMMVDFPTCVSPHTATVFEINFLVDFFNNFAQFSSLRHRTKLSSNRASSF